MTTPSKKLLITGASGFLGWQLCRLAAKDWRVLGLFHTQAAAIPGVEWIRADLKDYRSLKALMASTRPQAVIHAAAITHPNLCQEQPHTSARINVDAAVALAGLAADARIPLVFTSTDLVFDGSAPPYGESDPPSPICVYGEQKAMAETQMQQRYPETAICRLPLLFGTAGGAHQGFAVEMIRRLAQGKVVKLFVDEYRTPVDTGSAAHGLLMCLEGGHKVVHLGGRTRMSRFELGRTVERLLGRKTSSIEAVRLADMPMAAPRSPDVSLDSSRAYQMGYRPLGIEEAFGGIIQNLGLL